MSCKLMIQKNNFFPSDSSLIGSPRDSCKQSPCKHSFNSKVGLPEVDVDTYFPLIGTKFFVGDLSELDNILQILTVYLQANPDNLVVASSQKGSRWTCNASQGFETAEFEISLFSDEANNRLVLKFHRIHGAACVFSHFVKKFSELSFIKNHCQVLSPKTQAVKSVANDEFKQSESMERKRVPDVNSIPLPKPKLSRSSESSFKDYCEIFTNWLKDDVGESLSGMVDSMPRIWADYFTLKSGEQKSDGPRFSHNTPAPQPAHESMSLLHHILIALVIQSFATLRCLSMNPETQPVFFDDDVDDDDDFGIPDFDDADDDELESPASKFLNSLEADNDYLGNDLSEGYDFLFELEAAEALNNSSYHSSNQLGNVYRNIDFLSNSNPVFDRLSNGLDLKSNSQIASLSFPDQGKKSALSHLMPYCNNEFNLEKEIEFFERNSENSAVSPSVASVVSSIASCLSDGSLSQMKAQDLSKLIAMALSCMCDQLPSGHGESKQGCPQSVECEKEAKELVRNVVLSSPEFMKVLQDIPSLLEGKESKRKHQKFSKESPDLPQGLLFSHDIVKYADKLNAVVCN